uniref:Uncharacterized protein n=1 Tax=Anguilla anguilla TaxID=7936 RepID=A0A0E9Q3U5_ANGAN
MCLLTALKKGNLH